MGSQRIRDLRALVQVSARVGWGLLIGVLAILGLPPFGMFRSEYMLFSALLEQIPYLLPVLAAALVVAMIGLLKPTHDMVLGDAPSRFMQVLPYRPRRLPIILHLGLAAVLGIYMPPLVLDAYQRAAWVLGGG